MLVALAQTRPAKADYAENLRRVGAVISQVSQWDESPGLIVFGETLMSGYFLEGGVRESAVTAGTLYRDLSEVHARAQAPPLDICLGFYEEHHSRIFNAALYATFGGDEAGIRHVHRKVFLPTYGLFDEQRFVDAGHSVRAFDTAWGRVAILICEDVWHSASSTIAALDGAQLILVPSASPARGIAPIPSGAINNTETWDRVMRRVAEEHGVYAALIQIVGFEGGKGFQGCSIFVGPDGEIVARAPEFEEAVLRVRLDKRALARARADQPLLSDLEVALPNLLRDRGSGRQEPLRYDRAEGETRAVDVPAPARHRVVDPCPPGDPLAIDPALTERWLVTFLREEVSGRRGFTKSIVALSGGVDSSVSATLATRAFGPENVIGVRLPYRTSSSESVEHAALVAAQLGIELLTIDISDAVDGFYTAAGEDGSPTRRGNVMARMRMIALFDLSAKFAALPLGTGNKTERLLGYFTWHADDSPPVNPLGDLFKTQVWALARHLGVPDEIVEKPATADLIEGQTDEDDLGISYPQADLILYWLVSGLSPDEIVERGFPSAKVGLVKRRLDTTHWKRRLPTVAMVSGTAIGESYLRPVDY